MVDYDDMMPDVGKPPRAVIFPDGRSHQAWCFETPRCVLSGTAGDWAVLADYLKAHRVTAGMDRPEPPGALVGGFDFDGGFYFEHYDHVHSVPRDTIISGRAHACLRADGSVRWNEPVDRAAYRRMVAAAREHIAAGDIYQVNLARSYSAEVEALGGQAAAWRFFGFLTWLGEAPLGAFLPFHDAWVASASPELFIKISGNYIETRPIKGTRPRDRDAARDAAQAIDLRMNPKEAAELVMITDLERNDLGQICHYGSVQVTEFLALHSFSHVHHLVSTVTGRLRQGVEPVQAIAACFPGGSITGAPKSRAVEIIRELEPEPRGLYTGALGYFGLDGTAQFNIAIRTAVLRGREIRFSVGSGITWESDADLEFEETQHKAELILQAVDAFRIATNVKTEAS